MPKFMTKWSVRTAFWFTLGELIVVITILAVLATIGFLALSGYSQDAREASAKSNVRSVYAAISSESAMTGNSPRYYVIHDTGAALSWAAAYVDGIPVTLVGGDWNQSWTNYSAGNPDWAKLKLNKEKFRISSTDPAYAGFRFYGWRSASAAYDTGAVSIGAFDWTSIAWGKKRSGSYVQVASIPKSTENAVVIGDYPAQPAGAAAWLVAANSATAPLSALSDGNGASGVDWCPAGFVKVPGNPAFSTTDFCLAKYEMKFADTSGKTQNSPTGWTTWNYMTGATYVSSPNGTPVAMLTQAQAIAWCSSMWTGFHLVTNNEWMSAARSAESVADNWSGWSVGVGGIFRGNNGTGSDALWCDEPDNVAPAGADSSNLSSARSSCSQKRQLKLSNGEILWDLAGDVWEHVNGANTLDGSNYGTMQETICSGTTNWYSFSGSDGSGGGACPFQAPYSYSTFGPSTPGMNIGNGIGTLYSTPTASTDHILLRGGDQFGIAGIYTMHTKWTTSQAGYLVGFRCAYKP